MKTQKIKMVKSENEQRAKMTEEWNLEKKLKYGSLGMHISPFLSFTHEHFYFQFLFLVFAFQVSFLLGLFSSFAHACE